MDYQKAAPSLISFSLFPWLLQNRLGKFNSELSEVHNEILGSAVTKTSMNRLKKKIVSLPFLHILVQLF